MFGDGYRISVVEQLVDGDRVCSRFTVTGTHRGRSIELWGLVTSRVVNGQIVEDWAATDTIQVLRQLGLWRSALLGITELRRAVRHDR